MKQIPKFPLMAFSCEVQALLQKAKSASTTMSEPYLGGAMLGAIATACAEPQETYYGIYKVIPQVWVALSGDSGTNKSESISILTNWHEDQDRKYAAVYEDDLERYEIEAGVKGAKAGGGARSPKRVKKMVSNVNIHSLIMQLSNNVDLSAGYHKCEPLIFIKDELIGMINKHGEDMDDWLTAWSGKTLDKIRITTGYTNVGKYSFSIVGGVQDREVSAMRSGSLANNGFFFRWLFCPNDPVKRQKMSESDYFRLTELGVELRRELSAYYSRLHSLTNVRRDFFFGAGSFNIIEDCYHGFELRKEETQDDDLRSYLSKLQVYLPRLALILAIGDLSNYEGVSGNAIGISVSNARGAVDLVNYFLESYVYISHVHSVKKSEDEAKLTKVERFILLRLPALIYRVNEVDKSGVDFNEFILRDYLVQYPFLKNQKKLLIGESEVSPASVYNCLRSLEKKGYFTHEFGQHNYTDLYMEFLRAEKSKGNVLGA